MRYFAIGDIHGKFDLLRKLMKRVDKQKNYDDQVVFLGDYLDRGPESYEVIDFLIERKGDIFLSGNHDEEIRRACRYGVPFDFYNSVNDEATFDSYKRNGFNFPDKCIPQGHIEFFAGLWSYYDTEHAFFVHAGVDPYKNLTDQSDNDYLWIRAPFLNWPGPFAKTIVHGHSITKTGRVEFDGRKISVDTGAVRNNRISAAIVENGKLVDVID